MKGFKEFILRGNVVDLAVAFVIGVAFAAVVTALVENVINPLISAFFLADSLDQSLILTIGGTQVLFGAFLGAVINFVIIAAAVYFLFVLPLNHFMAKHATEKEEIEAEPNELELLADIRDLLARPATSSEGKHTP